jgi:DEAD/DEAH box helicase domain-containing protein
MIPSILSSQIRTAVEGFLKTTFPMANKYFSGAMEKLLAGEGSVFKGPFVSLGLPFRLGSSSSFFPSVPLGFTPFLHQEQAFARLQSSVGASTLIATGTGSGKTESFLLPILSHCLSSSGSGVKAVIVYPMNALATDQAGRIASLIHSNPLLRDKVTAGLYVGSKSGSASSVMSATSVITSRAKMRVSPPDILLTNYKMLDYMLIRPSDYGLWNGAALRYLVVDELHTFDGAQGTDLACLVRRLRARVGASSSLCCVGTSATLGVESVAALCSYAARVFGTPFSSSSVITESRVSASEFLASASVEFWNVPMGGVLPLPGEDSSAYLFRQRRLWFGSADVSGAYGCVRHFLFRKLIEVVGHSALSFDDVLTALVKVDPGVSGAAVVSMLSVLSASRVESQPLVHVRLRLWMRELQRMVASVSTEPVLGFSADLTPAQLAVHLPVIHCRECGATGWGGVLRRGDNVIQPDLNNFYRSYFGHDSDTLIVFPESRSIRSLGLSGMSYSLCTSCITLHANTDVALCHCGSSSFVPVYQPDSTCVRNGKASVHHNCPYCSSHDSLTILGSRAASLTSVMISQLMSSQFNTDRKLLTFSDSVQDAAHRAGFFQARTWRFNLRTAVQKFVAEGGEGLSLPEFASGFDLYWKGRFSPEEFVSSFIAPNMMWFEDFETMTAGNGVPGRLIGSVSSRLNWEIHSEYGFSSRIGRTLDRSGASAVFVDYGDLSELLSRLRNLSGNLRTLELLDLSAFVAGLLMHMKQKGAVAHSAVAGYVHDDGKEYMLSQAHIPWMPSFGGSTRAPVFPVDSTRGSRFEKLISSSGSSWYQGWLKKCFPFGVDNEAHLILSEVFSYLVSAGVLRSYSTRSGNAWGIEPARMIVTGAVTVLTCSGCGQRITVPASFVDMWKGVACLQKFCFGKYDVAASSDDYYKSFYSSGEVQRLFAAEHTGLLERSVRETLEEEFKASVRKPWFPNLLSSTPTLEMGIDIGDLSSLILCSVPPSQANYLQRTGRAGRRDGNALTLTVAAGRPHDLYFYSDPLLMIQGDVATPDVFLGAGAVLARQLVAYCFDRWVQSGADASSVPPALSTVFSSLDSVDQRKFPWNLVSFVEANADSLFIGFSALFDDSLSTEVCDQLRIVTHGGKESSGSLRSLVLQGLLQCRESRDGFRKTVRSLNGKIKQKNAEVARSSSWSDELSELVTEKKAFQQLAKDLDKKSTFNFLTDEGILPNYAFPEAGVQLKSLVYRKRKAGGSDTWSYEYERAASTAISELVPGSHFYAEGRRVQIDQIDMKQSEVQEWRFCDQCSHSELYSSDDTRSACPNCGSSMWADEGQKRSMVRLKQVFATTSDRKSRISDDSEDRKPSFYNKQMLVDFKSMDVEGAWKLSGEDLPFGFEYLKRVIFREINFGEHNSFGEQVCIAGLEMPRNGFRVCKSCGKVQFKRDKQVHSLTCPAKNKESDSNFISTLYLYREFSSEAVRFLLPVSAMSGTGVLDSFIAALQLGLRLKYGGSVDHLRVTSADEPVKDSVMRKTYLVLYDTVPGGTGYLKNLMKDPSDLMEVFTLARNRMKSCSCCQDPEKDGCYSCLYAYRDSIRMHSISRDKAIEFLGSILERREKIEKTSSLRTIGINSWLESELESLFIQKLAAVSGIELKKQVVNGKQGWFLKAGESTWNIESQVFLDVAVPSRADFVFYPLFASSSVKPVVVFTDGYSFHKDRIGIDMLQRTALVRSGEYNVWSLTWNDVAGTSEDFFENYLVLESAKKLQLFNGVKEAVNVSSVNKLFGDDSFRWFARYLNTPDRGIWMNYAWAFCYAHLDPSLLSDETGHFHWKEKAKQISGDLFQLFYPFDSSVLCGSSVCEQWSIHVAQDLKQVQTMDVSSMKVLLHLDDRMREDGFQKEWNSFLRLLNLMQFLPGCIAHTASGRELTAEIEALCRDAEEIARLPEGNEEWSEVLELAHPSVADLCRSLQDNGSAVPEVGVDLTGNNDEVVCNAELVWPDEKLIVLLSGDMGDSRILEEMGWKVISAGDASEKPMAVVSFLRGGDSR